MSELTESAVRAEVRAWLEANWKPDYGLVEWRTKLIESGWGAPHWPKQWYGRDLPVKFNAIVDEEFHKVGAVGVAGLPQGVDEKAAEAGISAWNKFRASMKK